MWHTLHNMQRAPRYPADLKRAVVEHAQTHGYPETYQQWPDIEPATIRGWLSRAGVTTPLEKRSDTTSKRWAEYREVMADEMAAVAEKALRIADQALDAGKGREAKDAVLTLAILVDKAQLLSGGATSRSEHLEPARAAEEMLDELAQRRDAA